MCGHLRPAESRSQTDDRARPIAHGWLSRRRAVGRTSTSALGYEGAHRQNTEDQSPSRGSPLSTTAVEEK